MARLTISLPDDLHRALKETAARRGRTIADLIAESLVEYGVKSRESAESIVASARRRAAMTAAAAERLAVAETRAARRR